jgi:membrane protein involved in colicin uptake
MKDVQKELVAISKTLSSLVHQMERMAEAIEKERGKAVPARKVKAPARKVKAPARKAKAPARKAKAPAKKAKALARKAKAPAKKAAVKSKTKASAAPGGQTMLDNIFGMISRSRNGITVERLKKRAALEARQVSNALYKLTQKGKIETLKRGVYIKKKK